MAQNLLERLKQSPVLCDGAMGTLLYAKGIFINRCYDELNVSQPELIRGIHHDYLQAGAEIVETNTFGGNSFRLARHSLADRVRDINWLALMSRVKQPRVSMFGSPDRLAHWAFASSRWARLRLKKPGRHSANKSQRWSRAASIC
jgi:homocysteine S-methyltransferase